jgi:hypothetical protein
MTEITSNGETTGTPGTIVTDNEGNVSTVRIMSLICLAMAMYVTFLDTLGYAKGDNVVMWGTMYLVAAFAPKVVQKFAEMKRFQG